MGREAKKHRQIRLKVKFMSAFFEYREYRDVAHSKYLPEDETGKTVYYLCFMQLLR